MPEAHAFPENTSTPFTPPHKPIDLPIFDTFMEKLRNNKPCTPDSSDLTINISSETKIQSKPNPNLKGDDNLVRQSISNVKFIVALEKELLSLL